MAKGNGFIIDTLSTWRDLPTTSHYDFAHPWVENTSRPNSITNGLKNHHIALWASHGRYYDQAKGFWKWQRPFLFGTTEDLYTQTIVLPFLIPMLENAGAVVFTPRERDPQPHEVIVDNDSRTPYPTYIEIDGSRDWEPYPVGFRFQAELNDGDNPFTQGTARQAKAIRSGREAEVYYQPTLPEAGRYAVYVSYQTTENSIPDAHYTVVHRGIATNFKVNQRMGGGTWVYLGTFDFDEGSNANNCVVLTNQSAHKGIVTTDAVRFGGGMGNVIRNGQRSNLPRSLEGARYYAQWAGAPAAIYNHSEGTSDYKDDINVRSMMTNWLAGSSAFVPTLPGLAVPIELSVAIHSDAGYQADGTSLKASLAICTTNHNFGYLNAGLERSISKQFADRMLTQTFNDLSTLYGRWDIRALWDRNYSETRLPEVPSIIFETLSHQNFPDMRLGQNPRFKFHLARSIYKTILRQVAALWKEQAVVQPLPPTHFRVEPAGENRVQLSWQPQQDPLEPTAKPTAYNLYTAIEDQDFDNGQLVTSNSVLLNIEPATRYRFRVTAVNQGGESFPTTTLATYYQGKKAKDILVIDGFRRLDTPAIIDNDSIQGFDFQQDMGVQYGTINGWSGPQVDFDRTKIGREGPGALGYSNQDWQGQLIRGNTFDHAAQHMNDIATAGKYNIYSCEASVVENKLLTLNRFAAADLILGLEKQSIDSLAADKAFTPEMQQALCRYLDGGGRLLVSGSYLGSDSRLPADSLFLNRYLKVTYAPEMIPTETPGIVGLGMKFQYQRALSHRQYAVQHPETLLPTEEAFAAMCYQDNNSAAVAYQGPLYRTFTMGFPFESITDRKARQRIIVGILKFLTDN